MAFVVVCAITLLFIIREKFAKFRMIKFIIVFFALLCNEPCRDPKQFCISNEFSFHQKNIIRQGVSIWGDRFREGRCDVSISKASELESKTYKLLLNDADIIGVSNKVTNQIVLITESINNDNELRWITAHEVGHWLNLDHVDVIYPAVMNYVLREDVINDLKLYPKDLEQLVKP